MRAFERNGWILLLVSIAGIGVAACGDTTTAASASASATPPAKSPSAKASTSASSAPAPSSTSSAVAVDSPCAKAVGAMFKLKHPKDQESPEQTAREIKTCETDKWSQKGIDCILAAKDAATADKCDLKK
jgi:hypothetical protein